jgi:hypothetical protein
MCVIGSQVISDILPESINEGVRNGELQDFMCG